MDNQLIRALMHQHHCRRIRPIRRGTGNMRNSRKRATSFHRTKARQIRPASEWLDDIDKPTIYRHMNPRRSGAGLPVPRAPENRGAAKVLFNGVAQDTGWSYAWRIPLWARVGDGCIAHQQLNGTVQRRTLANLFELRGPVPD